MISQISGYPDSSSSCSLSSSSSSISSSSSTTRSSITSSVYVKPKLTVEQEQQQKIAKIVAQMKDSPDSGLSYSNSSSSSSNSSRSSTSHSSLISSDYVAPKLTVEQERQQNIAKILAQTMDSRVGVERDFAEYFILDAYLENRKVIAQQRSEIAQRLVTSQQKIEDAQQKKLEAQQVKLEAGKRIKELDDEKVTIERRKQEIAVKKQDIAKEEQRIITQIFYGIFHKKEKCPDTQTVFETYLADKSVTIESNEAGKNYAKINSMRAVIRYLDDHPTLRGCDFRAFKSEVEDISTLATYLSTSKTITVIAIKMGIPEIEKVYLKDAEKARKGTLKVQYFA